MPSVNEKPMLSSPSSNVGASRVRISVPTGLPSRNVLPKSRCSAPHTHFPYCTGTGSFRLSSWRTRTRACGDAVSPRIDVTGSPGSTCVIEKPISVTKNSTTTEINNRRTTKAAMFVLSSYRHITLTEMRLAVAEHVERDALVPDRQRVGMPEKDVPAVVVDEVAELVELGFPLGGVERGFEIGEHLLELRIGDLVSGGNVDALRRVLEVEAL